jgi:TM2 domain-containing membrane protein YozV
MSTPDMTGSATTAAMNAAQLGVSTEVRAMMMFEANKKEACVAYVLWFFFGYFGAHNFYLKRIGVAVVQLLLTLTIVGLAINFFWHLVDAFLIPGWVRRENNHLLTWMLGIAPFAR